MKPSIHHPARAIRERFGRRLHSIRLELSVIVSARALLLLRTPRQDYIPETKGCGRATGYEIGISKRNRHGPWILLSFSGRSGEKPTISVTVNEYLPGLPCKDS